MAEERSRDVPSFLADVALCESYLQGVGLVPACDTKVRGLIIARLRNSTEEHTRSSALELLRRVKVYGRAAMVEALSVDPAIVWITCATQFGLTFGEGDDNLVLTHGRIVGVAGASALSGAYGGLSLHAWDANLREPGKRLARFSNGKDVILE